MQQRLKKEPNHSPALDDGNNQDDSKVKYWYIECLARKMGHIIKSAKNDVLPTNSDNQELVSEQFVKNNDVYQVSLNKWPPLPEIDRYNANLHDPALDGNCLFNSFIIFLAVWRMWTITK